MSGGLIAQVKQMQYQFLGFGLQRGQLRRNGNGEFAVVNQVAHALNRLRHTDQPVELGDAHAHLLGQLCVALKLVCGISPLAPAGFLLHALHLHTQGAGQVVAGDFVTVQVSVRNNDLGAE